MKTQSQTLAQLKKLAHERGIKGYYKMNKQQLQEALGQEITGGNSDTDNQSVASHQSESSVIPEDNQSVISAKSITENTGGVPDSSAEAFLDKFKNELEFLETDLTHFEFSKFWDKKFISLTSLEVITFKTGGFKFTDFAYDNPVIKKFMDIGHKIYKYVQSECGVIYQILKTEYYIENNVQKRSDNITIENKSVSEFKKQFEYHTLNLVVQGEEKKILEVNLSTLVEKLIFKVKKYNNVIFFPYSPLVKPIVDDNVNLFNGYCAKPLDRKIEDKEVQPLLDYVDNILAYNEHQREKVFKFILDYFATKLQRPDLKTKVCLVFKSAEKQVGKGQFIGCILKYLLSPNGRLWYKPKSIQDYKKQFNEFEFGKIFSWVDEVEISRKDGQLDDIIKQKITEEDCMINEKFKNSKAFRCHQDFIFCSNHEFPVVSDDKDARFVVIDVCSDIKFGKRSISINNQELHGNEYFKEFNNWFKTNADIILTWFLQRETPKFITDIPYTNNKSRQTEVYAEPKDTFTLLLEDLFKAIPCFVKLTEHEIKELTTVNKRSAYIHDKRGKTIMSIFESHNIKITTEMITDHFNYCPKLNRWMYNEDLLTYIGAQLKLGKGHGSLKDRINKMLDKIEIHTEHHIKGLPKKKRYTVKQEYYNQLVEELEEEYKHKDEARNNNNKHTVVISEMTNNDMKLLKLLN
jgi:hypothetical protein